MTRPGAHTHKHSRQHTFQLFDFVRADFFFFFFQWAATSSLNMCPLICECWWLWRQLLTTATTTTTSKMSSWISLYCMAEAKTRMRGKRRKLIVKALAKKIERKVYDNNNTILSTVCVIRYCVEAFMCGSIRALRKEERRRIFSNRRCTRMNARYARHGDSSRFIIIFWIRQFGVDERDGDVIVKQILYGSQFMRD